jgi:hypothetical protein
LFFLQYRCASKRLQLAKREVCLRLWQPRSSSAAAAQALVILVQAELVTAGFADHAHLAETAHSATDPANQKSLDLPVLVLVQVLPVRLELEVKPTAY